MQDVGKATANIHSHPHSPTDQNLPPPNKPVNFFRRQGFRCFLSGSKYLSKRDGKAPVRIVESLQVQGAGDGP